MKKKIIIYGGIVIVVGIIALTVIISSQKKPDSIYLSIKCDDADLSKEYKENDIIECNLHGEKYTFTIKNISKGKVALYSNKCLSTNGSDCPNNIELSKGKELNLKTPTSKEIHKMIIEWK